MTVRDLCKKSSLFSRSGKFQNSTTKNVKLYNQLVLSPCLNTQVWNNCHKSSFFFKYTFLYFFIHMLISTSHFQIWFSIKIIGVWDLDLPAWSLAFLFLANGSISLSKPFFRIFLLVIFLSCRIKALENINMYILCSKKSLVRRNMLCTY